MKKLLICILFFLFHSSFSYSQSWDWAEGGYGSIKSNVYGGYIATDKKGNAYASGTFNISITFGTYTFSNPGDNSYLVKYNSAGDVKWAYLDLHDEYGPPVAVDTASNVYLTGNNYIPNNIYLTKLDTNGNVLWQIGPSSSTGSQYGKAIASDKDGYLYVAGYFSGKFTFGSVTLSAHEQQMFVIKFDLNGKAIWGRQSGTGTDTETVNTDVYDVRVDNKDNVYLTGTFGDSIQFGSYHFYSPYLRNGVVYVKYDSAGNLKWAVNPHVPYSCYSAAGTSITIDNAGNSYLAGYFADTIEFGPITLANAAGQWTAFLAKYDTNGQPIWAEQAKGYSQVPSLTKDRKDNIFLTGGCKTSLTFGGMTWTKPEQSVFLIRLDTSGHAVCGSLMDAAVGQANITCDSTGTFIYIAGTSYDTLFAGPDTLISLHGEGVPFVARWQPCTDGGETGISEVKAKSEQVKAYPNPSNGVFQLEITNYKPGINNEIEVYNVLGEKVYSTSLLISNSSFLINLSNQPNGIYLYRVITETGNLVGEGKLVIAK